MEKETVVNLETGYIKLYKLTKTYNWEIKLFETYNLDKYQEIIDTLQRLDQTMHEKFRLEYEEE